MASPVWPPAHRKPVPRALYHPPSDVAADWMEIDFCPPWRAKASARAGAGMGGAGATRSGSWDGSAGRLPLDRQWYVSGRPNETGCFPALSRNVGGAGADDAGRCPSLRVADRYERLEIANRTAIAMPLDLPRWGQMLARDPRLADCDQCRLNGRVALSCFGWFAAEAKAAGSVRRCWREERGLGRDTNAHRHLLERWRRWLHGWRLAYEELPPGLHCSPLPRPRGNQTLPFRRRNPAKRRFWRRGSRRGHKDPAMTGCAPANDAGGQGEKAPEQGFTNRSRNHNIAPIRTLQLSGASSLLRNTQGVSQYEIQVCAQCLQPRSRALPSMAASATVPGPGNQCLA